MEYIASFSGGKDSMATIILAHEHGEPLDKIIFSEVMFDRETSGELPEHIQFIKEKCIPLFTEWGYETEILHAEKTYMDCFNHVLERARTPERIGKRRGFPMAGKCWANRDLKVKPIHDFYKQKNLEEITQYIGIAQDEPKRLKRLEGSIPKRVSLLAKYGYTEQMAFELCKSYDLLSPIYEFVTRGGCWFCPNAKYKELEHLRTYHRELWDKLVALEQETDLAGKIWNSLTKTSITELEEVFYWGDAQITIFDFLKEEQT